ncbi:MAG: adenylate/guanylate cyclase domain-containing protein [Bacteroidota bacterium]
MALLDDLKNKVSAYFIEKYEVEETTIVPGTDYSKLTFGNKGLVSEFAFLFVDIRKSSELHDTYGFTNAAKIYQSFHDICLRIIENNEGKVRAFDGDRIMGVFAGDQKRTNATKAAMNIRWAISKILNPNLTTPLRIGCGIDVGKTLITKVGKGRDINNNDLIWIGKACNYASHLTQEASDSIIISPNVYDNMLDKTKFKDSINKTGNMWTLKKITLKSNKQIDVYESSYYWPL